MEGRAFVLLCTTMQRPKNVCVEKPEKYMVHTTKIYRPKEMHVAGQRAHDTPCFGPV